MNFKLTEEQELLLESVREFMAQECSDEYMRQCDEDGVPPTEFFKKSVEAGFGLLGCPEDVGGTPVDNLTLMLVKEEFLKLGGPLQCLTNIFHIDMMKSFGTQEQLEECMAEINEGRMAFCSGFSEPQAGSDSHAILTSYERRNGKIILNGHKTFISSAGLVKHMACLARDFSSETEAFTMPLLIPSQKKNGMRPLNQTLESMT